MTKKNKAGAAGGLPELREPLAQASLPDPLLELREISYAYEGGQLALDGVSARFYPGEKVAVLGNNGAGKSTFFLCVNGVLKPLGGQLLFRGQEIPRKRRELLNLRKSVGIVFQEPDQQIVASTVESEISFGPMNLRLPVPEVEKRVDAAAAAMNLTEYLRRPPHYLSGGEKKRVSIADILAMEPEMILFDEPTASLDPRNSAMLEETLGELAAQGITLVVSTHDVDLAWRFAERVLVFHQGRIIADGPPEEIFADDPLIRLAGLEKPLLYQAAAELAELAGASVSGKKQAGESGAGPGALPKTLEEFRHFAKALLG